MNEDNNSLVLLMPFDEDNSSTAIDSSDFKNNGVLSGATLNRTDCITGNCYSFDGTNDFINLIDKSSLDFGASDFSIELWIKHPVSAITNGRIVYKGASSATDVGYALLGDAQNIFALSNGSTRLLVTAGKTNFNNDLWNHIAITVKRDNNITIYTNGIIDSSSSNPLNVSNFSGSVSNTKEFILGSIDGTGTFWNGSIDNVRIYNKALTSSEIQDHYEKYKLYYQPSFKFDGVNDMINITKDINDDFGKTGFTMESWIWNNINDQPQMSSSGVNILSDVGSGISDRYELRINNISSSPVIYYRIQDSNAINEEVSNAGNLNNNSWNHIIVTYDNVNAQIRAYANGVLTNTNPTAFTGTISPNDNLYIGIAGLVRDYKGSITGVRIYNRSLSANQIYELYNSYNTSALNKLVSEETTKGNTYKASVWVSDTRDEDVQRNSTELLIGNTIPTIPVLSYPPNNTYFKDDTPEFFINNSDDPDNDTIYFVLEIDNAFDFTSINYYNGTIRKISNGTNSHNLSSALTDGIYYWRTLATDLQGNSSYTEIRNFTIDTINSTIDFTSPTEANNTYTNNSYIFINVTVTEANFANITFYLVNSTSVNATLFTSLNNNARWINLSPLNQNEVYYYNVSVADLANNINYSETRIITLDNTLPNNITLLSPGNNTISTNRTPLFTWNNVTELNFDNYTLEIDNDADFTSVQFTFIKYNNLTNSTHLMTTPLNDNTRYFWKITVTDKANNRNSTTFTYTTDNTKPAVTLNSPGNNQWLTASTVNFQYIPTDTPFNSNLQACDLYGNFTSTTFEKNNTQTPAGGAINTFTLILADSSYTWNVQCNDSAGNSARAAANFTVNLDTVRPSLSYSGQTEVNNSYKNQNFIFVNWTYTEANFANLTFRLFNTTGNVNTTVYTSTAYQINVSNYTIYLINPNERYTYNITLTDYALQMNTTETRTIILDTINPSLSYSEQTLANNTYYNSNTLFVNWTYSDTNFANFTFTLANLTGVVNQTIYNTTAYQINLTLPNTNYSYNLTIRDLANNYNETSTRVVVLDNAIPVPIYDSRTEANNTYVQRNWAFINITLTETNLANITYVISNSSFTNITVFGSRTLDINFTNLADGNYTYNVTIRDLANNVNSTETRLISIDAAVPLIEFGNSTEANNTQLRQNWTFINITFTETNVANITFRLFNQTSLVNETVSPSTNIIRAINFTNLPNINNIRYTYNVTIVDFSNNENVTETRTIILDNVLPSIPTLGNPRNDTWQLYDNSTSFGWQDSTDLENSTLNYEFQLSNNTVFNNTYFIKNINITQSNYTLTVNEMPSVGRHYWRVRAYDGTNYSSYSSLFQVDIVYAVINITSPNYNSIVRILNTYEFKVEEIANTNWTQRVNITFTAAGTSYGPFLMTNNSDPLTNYTYNFTIPNVNPGFLTVVATGYNETLSINATSRFRITIPETPAVTRPGITDAYSINTYTYPNVSANITVRSDLSVLLNTITVQIFQPNGTTSTLTSTVNNEDNADDEDFNYEHNYTFTPGDLGEHIIAVSITDTNYPDSAYIAYKNNSFYVNTSRGISLIASGAGLNNITLKDIYSRHTLNKLNNSENVTIIPGNYDIKVSTSKIEAELINGTIYENPITLCSFEDIEDTVDPPSNVRSVDQFTLDCGNSTYNSVNLTYNYTNIIGSVTFEENLNIYKCDSTSSCSWVRQNKSLDTTNNLIIARFSNFSVFMLSEDTSTTTTTVATSGGAGGGSGGGLSRLIAIDIIQPGNLTIYEEDTIITPIKIKNTGKTSLFGIFLVASTLNEGLELSLDNNFISALIPGQEDATNLRIVSRNFTGENAEVLVTAKVTTPVVQDQVKFLLNVLTGGKTKAEEQITFAEEFFNGNPECLELKELLDQAQIALDNREYDEAVKIVDSAIQSCKNLLSLEGKQPRLPTEAELSDLLILGLETLVFFILTYSMYNYYKKRRLRNLNK
ncbi:LamG domain-containing protein [Candidatus Woesearchaeota archaeon]|nr:LamG domain-containing protein [Candidatus Woesearchaeota archaeon]